MHCEKAVVYQSARPTDGKTNPPPDMRDSFNKFYHYFVLTHSNEVTLHHHKLYF